VTLLDYKQFLTQQVENNISISFFSLDERFQSMYFFISDFFNKRQGTAICGVFKKLACVAPAASRLYENDRYVPCYGDFYIHYFPSTILISSAVSSYKS